jgi:hypothetical protein
VTVPFHTPAEVSLSGPRFSLRNRPHRLCPVSKASARARIESRGHVVDLAIGVVIGVAFGAIVASLVADIIMPIIGAT